MPDCSDVYCSQPCTFQMVGDKTCDADCKNEECSYDGGDCDCATGCSEKKQTNTVCDSSCNNKACNFDNYKCVGFK
jgi:hypothetical protein